MNVQYILNGIEQFPNSMFFLFLQYNKHLFVHIGQSSPSYNDPYLEAVDIRQIYDKFPEKKGGLKELFERGPANAFFLVKFWVREGPFRGYPFAVKFLTLKAVTSLAGRKLLPPNQFFPV